MADEYKLDRENGRRGYCEELVSSVCGYEQQTELQFPLLLLRDLISLNMESLDRESGKSRL